MPPHQVLSPCMFLLLAGVVSAARHETSHTQMGPTQEEQYAARAYFIFEEEIAEGGKWQLILGNVKASVLAQHEIPLETATHDPVKVTDILNVGTPGAKGGQKARRAARGGSDLPTGEVVVKPVDSPMDDFDNQTGDDGRVVEVHDSILQHELPIIEQTLAKARKDHDVVLLVHCDQSVNRSPTVVLAWLVSTRGFSLRDAYRKVYAAKQYILDPTPLYRDVLMKFESTPSISLSDPPSYWDDWFALHTITCLSLLEQYSVELVDAECKRLIQEEDGDSDAEDRDSSDDDDDSNAPKKRLDHCRCLKRWSIQRLLRESP